MFVVKPDTKVIKGMIFAGCSFTWGQGLYYYSNLPTLDEPRPGAYDADIVRFSHYEFLKTVRYPRLVSNHFNTFEVCQPFNGGATHSILHWWQTAFGEKVNDRDKSLNGDDRRPKYDYSDFSDIFFQCTQWARSMSPVKLRNEEGHYFNSTHFGTMEHPDFFKYLEDNKLTIEQYMNHGRMQDIQDIKSFLQEFENNGVRAHILSWPFDMVPYIQNDPWLKERFITFNYNGIRYTNMEDLMGPIHENRRNLNHPELTIERDTDFFQDPPHDHHPSLSCHRFVADTIIKHMENK